MFLLMLALLQSAPADQVANQNGADKLMLEQKAFDTAKAALKTRVKATEVKFDKLWTTNASVVCGQFNARYNFSMFAGYEPFIFNSETGAVVLPSDKDFRMAWTSSCPPH